MLSNVNIWKLSNKCKKSRFSEFFPFLGGVAVLINISENQFGFIGAFLHILQKYVSDIRKIENLNISTEEKQKNSSHLEAFF